MIVIVVKDLMFVFVLQELISVRELKELVKLYNLDLLAVLSVSVKLKEMREFVILTTDEIKVFQFPEEELMKDPA